MARFTTIVAVIAGEAAALAAAVTASSMNVGAVLLASTSEDLDERQRRIAGLRAAERVRSVYTLVDFDVMQPMIDEWVARLAGEPNELDLESGRIPPIELPEYVLVADDISDDSVHWYLGLLRTYAPRRVVTTKPTPASITEALSHLKPDRAFPRIEVIASAALTYVPTAPTSS